MHFSLWAKNFDSFVNGHGKKSTLRQDYFNTVNVTTTTTTTTTATTTTTTNNNNNRLMH